MSSNNAEFFPKNESNSKVHTFYDGNSPLLERIEPCPLPFLAFYPENPKTTILLLSSPPPYQQYRRKSLKFVGTNYVYKHL